MKNRCVPCRISCPPKSHTWARTVLPPIVHRPARDVDAGRAFELLELARDQSMNQGRLPHAAATDEDELELIEGLSLAGRNRAEVVVCDLPRIM